MQLLPLALRDDSAGLHSRAQRRSRAGAACARQRGVCKDELRTRAELVVLALQEKVIPGQEGSSTAWSPLLSSPGWQWVMPSSSVTGGHLWWGGQDRKTKLCRDLQPPLERHQSSLGANLRLGFGKCFVCPKVVLVMVLLLLIRKSLY